MSKFGFKLGNVERFVVENTNEFKKDDFYLKIEQVKDTMLKKEWYNVIWTNIPKNNIQLRNTFKFLFLPKSKSYKSEKDALKHFHEIIQTLLK